MRPPFSTGRPIGAVRPEIMPFSVGGSSSSDPTSEHPKEEAGETEAAVARGLDANANLGEKMQLKAKKRPFVPTPEEVEQHNIAHWTYRSWCRWCVASCGRRDGHPSVSTDSRDEGGVVTISCDYCYFCDGTDGKVSEEDLEKSHTAVFGSQG